MDVGDGVVNTMGFNRTSGNHGSTTLRLVRQCA